MFLLDSCIFISILKGNPALLQWVAALSNPHLDYTIYIEVLQGSTKSNHEKRGIKAFLDTFPCLWLTPEIGKTALRLIDTYSNSHGLLLPDSLVAASALEYGLRLITYNINDFRFIKNFTVGVPPVPQI